MAATMISSLESDIAQLSAAEFWVALIVLLLVSGWSFIKMSRNLHHKRTIENVPTAKVRSAAQGYVELVGRTQMIEGPLIVSPLSGTTCVWYSYIIEEKVRHRHNGKSRSYWRQVEKKTSEDLFLLNDGTGQCVIDPDDADVIVKNKKTWYKHHVIPPRRYTERIIIEGEELYAIGLFKSQGEISQRHFREHVAQLLRHWKNDPNQLIHRYDHNRDGKLGAQEWDKARIDAERQVRQKQGNSEKLQQLHLMTASPHHDQAYILSTVAERELIKKYNWRILLSFIAFLAAGSVSAWACNVRLSI